MKLGNLCRREVVSIAATATPRDAAALMCEEHVGALAVLTNDDPPKVVGIVTDRDLALEVLGRPDAGDIRVGSLAKAPPLAVPSGADVQEAIDAMASAGVRRLLVVDDDGGVVGLVSFDDLVMQVAMELETLSRSLRIGLDREAAERKVVAAPRRARPVYPAFGTAAAQ